MTVRVKDPLAARDGGNEHHESRLREMEVRDQSVDRIELVTRGHKERRIAGTGLNPARARRECQ